VTGRAGPATSTAAAAGTHWAAVLAGAFTGVAAAMNVGKVPVSLPLMRSEFGLSLVQAGWVSSMLTTLAVASAMGVGLMVGRVGAMRMVIAGLLLGAIGSVGALAAPGFVGLLSSRVIEGAGFLFVAVSGPALVSAAAAPHDRRFALGVWSSYMPLGAGIAMAMAPWLLPSAGWRALWIASAGVLLLSAALVWGQRRVYAAAQASTHAVAAPGPALAVLRRPLPWLLAITFGAWAMQHFALIIWLPTFLKEQRDLPAGIVAGLTCAMLLANVPGNLIGGWLVQRGLPRGRLIAAAHMVTGLCGWWLFDDSLPDALRFGLCVLLSFSGGLIPAAVMSSSTVLARSPQQIGALQGLIMQGSQLGQFIGTPLIASVVAASGHWSSARWVTAGAATLGMLLGLLSVGHERRLQPLLPPGAPP
jgi:predicted MFS family arabinose efflux permease